MRQVRFTIADLDGSTLGHAGSDVIYVDRDAAGYGWFTDVSPAGEPAFGHRVAADESRADASSPAAGHVDLLTLMMHEMGHVVGLDDLDPLEHPHELMTEDVSTGMRRLPRWDAAGEDVEVHGPATVFTSISALPDFSPRRTSISLATPGPEGNPPRFAPSPARPTVVRIPSRDARLSLVPMEVGTFSLDSIPHDLISEVALLGRKQLLGQRRGR